jgi:hypothetical protein
MVLGQDQDTLGGGFQETVICFTKIICDHIVHTLGGGFQETIICFLTNNMLNVITLYKLRRYNHV